MPPTRSLTTIHDTGRASRTSVIPRAATLDGFIASASATEGLNIRELDPLTTLIVRTLNSCYRIIITRDTSVLVQGGHFFPDATAGRLDGSSFGGSFLKIAWICVGLRMEIFADGQRIITSPVRDISIERDAARRSH